jgi:hypothetical protein
MRFLRVEGRQMPIARGYPVNQQGLAISVQCSSGQFISRLSEFIVIQTGLNEPEAHVQLRCDGVRAKAGQLNGAAPRISAYNRPDRFDYPRSAVL